MKGSLSTFPEGSKKPHILELSIKEITAVQASADHTFYLEWLSAKATWELIRNGCHLSIQGIDFGDHDRERIPLEDQNVILCGSHAWRFERIPDPPEVAGAARTLIPLGNAGIQFARKSETPVPLPDGMLRIDLDANDLRVSREHARVSKADGEWVLEKIKGVVELNGRSDFTTSGLVYGDCFHIGSYAFEFRGDSVALVEQIPGAHVTAKNVGVCVKGGKFILQNFNLRIDPGEFVGILGPSGQGKSTFLNAASGIFPANVGETRANGQLIDGPGAMRRLSMGIVPQDDAVHRELTGLQAVVYCIRLRFNLSSANTLALANGVLNRLGMEEHKNKLISKMSGGQRKRVGIATELISRPVLLFLDEPNSGLDPHADSELISLLSKLSRVSKLTVGCTTHMLENAANFTKILFIHDGRLMFYGSAAEARLHFFNQDERSLQPGESLRPLADIYHAVMTKVEHGGKPPTEWEALFNEKRRDLDKAIIPPSTKRATAPPPKKPGYFSSMQTLLSRQWTILKSSPLNILFLLCQALLIGGLLGWISDDGGFRLFLAIIATMWFGCSNSGQRIISELPIFRQERVAGLGMHRYIQSKFVFLSGLTIAQSLLVLLCMTGVSYLAHPTDLTQAELTVKMMERDNASDTSKAPDGSALQLSPVADFRQKLVSLAGSMDAQRNSVLEPDAPAIPPQPQLPPQTLIRAARALGLEYNILHSGPGFAPDLQTGNKLFEDIESEDNIKQLIQDLDALEPAAGKNSWVQLVSNLPEAQLFTFRNHEGDPYLSKGLEWKPVFWTALLLRLMALLLASVVGVAIGLCLSALVQNELQAVLGVPLILIPLILFGSQIVTEPAMSSMVRMVARTLPSFSCQKISEVSQIYGQRVPELLNKTRIPTFSHVDEGKSDSVFVPRPEQIPYESKFRRLSPQNVAWQNLTVFKWKTGQHIKEYEIDSQKGTQGNEKETILKRNDVQFPSKTLFQNTGPAWNALIVLGIWIAVCYTLIWGGLILKQKKTK